MQQSSRFEKDTAEWPYPQTPQSQGPALPDYTYSRTTPSRHRRCNVSYTFTLRAVVSRPRLSRFLLGAIVFADVVYGLPSTAAMVVLILLEYGSDSDLLPHSSRYYGLAVVGWDTLAVLVVVLGSVWHIHRVVENIMGVFAAAVLSVVYGAITPVTSVHITECNSVGTTHMPLCFL